MGPERKWHEGPTWVVRDEALGSGISCRTELPRAGPGDEPPTQRSASSSQSIQQPGEEAVDHPPDSRFAAECKGGQTDIHHDDLPSQEAPAANGDTLNSLFAEVYQELRGMARGMLRTAPPNRTLQPTVLVHEAYLRLCHTYCAHGVNRQHFFGAASEAMRRILVEDARRRMTLRRGGKWARIPLDQLQVASDANPETLVGIDDALEKFSAQYPLKAQVVKLIFFGGLTAAEAGEALSLCDRTIKRHWAFARAWLYRELDESQ